MRLDISESSKFTRQWLGAHSIVLLVVLLGGCGNGEGGVKPEDGGILPPANPPTIAIEVKQPHAMPAGGKKPWLDTRVLPTTTWYAQYLNGKCIGFSQFTIETSKTQGSNLLMLTKRDVLEIAATSKNPVQRREIVLESLEQPNGQFMSYEETSKIDDAATESSARLERETLTTILTVDGKPTATNQKWPVGTWGPLGTIAILRQQPMGADEYRSAEIFVPPLNKIVKVEFKSKKWELMTLPGGVVSELLLVETQFITDEGSSLTKNWVNKAGEILKSVSQGGFTMFQSTRDEVERIDGAIQAAKLIETKIPVRISSDQLQSARLTFLIDSTNVDPFVLLSNKVNQQVKSKSTLGAEVTVHSTLPTEPIPEGAEQDPPDESHRSKFDADTAQLQKLLSEFTDTSADALSASSKLTEGVFRELKKSPLSRHFLTLGRTLKQREGDCKAHSILLIALLRDRGIPARAASGLRIVKDNDNQMVAIYHLWCEAWLGDRWLPLDPFTGSIGVGVDHIKFLESSLNDNDPNSAMLAVLQRMKKLTVTVKL